MALLLVCLKTPKNGIWLQPPRTEMYINWAEQVLQDSFANHNRHHHHDLWRVHRPINILQFESYMFDGSNWSHEELGKPFYWQPPLHARRCIHERFSHSCAHHGWIAPCVWDYVRCHWGIHHLVWQILQIRSKYVMNVSRSERSSAVGKLQFSTTILGVSSPAGGIRKYSVGSVQ